MSKKRTFKKEDSLKEQLARALADYDNLRKRVERERQDLEKLVSLKVIVKLLPILDMLEGIQKHLKDSGLAIAVKEFEDVLNDDGFERIGVSPGEAFNEDLHEAVEVVNLKDKKNGEIVEEILSGWKYGDGFVIRPTKVKVNKLSEEK